MMITHDQQPVNSVNLSETIRIPIAEEKGTATHICFVSMSLFSILTRSKEIEFAGGGEVQQTILARALRADGFRISVLTADHGQPDVIDCDGILVYKVPSPGIRGIKGLRFLNPIMSDIVARLDKIQPDILYYRVAGFRAAAVGWYARTRGKRFIYACASDREFKPRDISRLPRRDALLFRAALRMSDLILVQNLAQREAASNAGLPTKIVPNCYYEFDHKRAAHTGPVIWVGTFKPIKRPELFIELARRMPDIRFVMIGGADNINDRNQIYYKRMQAEAANVANLEFVGYVPFSEVGRYFDASSMLVNTSDSEGFPNTFLQAWIRGVPTLSFVRPEVEGESTGTIVCADINELELKIESLRNSHDLWNRESINCSDYFVRTHSVNQAVARYRQIFSELTGSSDLRLADTSGAP